MKFQKLFVAIPLPREHYNLAKKAEQQLALEDQQGVRWVRAEQLHLTVKFLGEVENRLLYQACELLKETCSDIPAFEIQLSGLGTFPPNKRPRVLWTGISAGNKELQSLHEKLDEAFLSIGVPVEGKVFRPHLTLARIGKSANAQSVEDLVRDHGSETNARFFANSVILYESEKVGRYYQYEQVSEVQLS